MGKWLVGLLVALFWALSAHAQCVVTLQLGPRDYLVTRCGTFSNEAVVLEYTAETDTSFVLYVNGVIGHRQEDRRNLVRETEYKRYLNSPYYQQLVLAGTTKKEAILQCRKAKFGLFSAMNKALSESHIKGTTEQYVNNLHEKHPLFPKLVEKTRWDGEQLAVKCYSSTGFITIMDHWHADMDKAPTFKDDFERSCHSLSDIAAHFDASDQTYDLVTVGDGASSFFAAGTKEKISTIIEEEKKRIRLK